MENGTIVNWKRIIECDCTEGNQSHGSAYDLSGDGKCPSNARSGSR